MRKMKSSLQIVCSTAWKIGHKSNLKIILKFFYYWKFFTLCCFHIFFFRLELCLSRAWFNASIRYLPIIVRLYITHWKVKNIHSSALAVFPSLRLKKIPEILAKLFDIEEPSCRSRTAATTILLNYRNSKNRYE